MSTRKQKRLKLGSFKQKIIQVIFGQKRNGKPKIIGYELESPIENKRLFLHVTKGFIFNSQLLT